MTQEEILEGNKLIAEFMGYGNREPYSIPKHSEDRETILFWGVTLKYNTSWDWLMPVVEKIEQIERGDKLGKFRLVFYGNNVSWNNVPPAITGETKIEATYKAVVQFIKWYNQQAK